MRDYEITVLVRGDLEGKKLDAWVKSFEGLLSKLSAKVKGELSVSRKTLAYEIAKMRDGHYVFGEISVKPESVASLESNFKNDELILRYLVVKK